MRYGVKINLRHIAWSHGFWGGIINIFKKNYTIWEDKIMQLQPIIRAKVSKFREMHDLEAEKDGIVFEYFANESILNNHQPNGSSISDELLEQVNVGGYDDMGLDGICIKLNGMLIQSIQDAKDLIELHNTAEIEFIFVQSKYKDKFDSGEYAKFANGVIDFLSDAHYQPMNSKVSEWLEIKNYLTSSEVLVLWSANPVIRLYYVVMGVWNESTHIKAISSKLKDDIGALNMYGDIYVNYIDTERFKRICDDNENQFTTVINIIDMFSLTAVNMVDNSSIILCSAEELMKLLITEDGIIRKGLFNDNVRDYQGRTTINQDIYSTIVQDPESFVLMNNGVTIICSDIIHGNRKITIKNPRIVNGCQSCSVLYNAYRKGEDISKVVISGKVISTKSSEVTNKIVRGTNRQNIVYDEAFECTREFHKQLEELFKVLSDEQMVNKVYYERRSKQYADVPAIKSYQKVSFRMLIQSFVSIFLNEPHKGHLHESRLLQEYKNKIFIDTQSKMPYYVAALIYVKTEQLLRKEVKYKNLRTYRAQIQVIIREKLGGHIYDINNEKNIDNYCKDILPKIYDDKSFGDVFVVAIELFEQTVKEWVEIKGQSYRYAIKDTQEFTEFLNQKLANSGRDSLAYRGEVIKVSRDRYNHYYGFISRVPSGIFFHSGDNPTLDYEKLLSQNVLYDIMKDEVSGKEKAINVRIVTD